MSAPLFTKPCPEMVDFSAPPQKRLGQYIRQLRIDAEITQTEMARRCKTHRPIVGRWESGLHHLTLEVLVRIAAALDLEIETLLVVEDPAWCEAGRLEALRAREGRAA